MSKTEIKMSVASEHVIRQDRQGKINNKLRIVVYEINGVKLPSRLEKRRHFVSFDSTQSDPLTTKESQFGKLIGFEKEDLAYLSKPEIWDKILGLMS